MVVSFLVYSTGINSNLPKEALMAAQPSQQQTTTALTVYPTEGLFGTIIGDLSEKLRHILTFNGAQRMRGIDRIIQDELIIRDEGGDAYVAMVTFSPMPHRSRHTTFRRARKRLDKRGEKWVEISQVVEDTFDTVDGEAAFPDQKGRPVKQVVRLSIVTTGKGGLIPAIRRDAESGTWLSGAPLPCLFHYGLKRKGQGVEVDESIIYALPIGLADEDKLSAWNRRAAIMRQLNKPGTWLDFDHIDNSIGTMSFLDFTPEFVGNGGQFTIWPNWINNKAKRPPNKAECNQILRGKLEPGKSGYEILGRFGGKVLIWDPGVNQRHNPPTDTQDNGMPIPTRVRATIVEGPNSIRLMAWRGRPQNTGVDHRSLDRGDTSIPDALELLGGSYQETNGVREIGELFLAALRTPPIKRLKAHDTWKEFAKGGEEGLRTWLTGTRVKLIQGATQQLTDAANIMEKALAPHSGTEGVSIGIRDLFDGHDELLAYLDRKGEWEGSHDMATDPFTEEAPDSIHEFMDFRRHGDQIAGNLLMQDILTSQVADRHGITEFNPNSWVLREVYTRLWKIICRSNGVVIPRRKKASTQHSGQQRATRA